MADKKIATYRGRPIDGEVDLQDLIDKLEELRLAIEALPAAIAAALAQQPE